MTDSRNKTIITTPTPPVKAESSSSASISETDKLYNGDDLESEAQTTQGPSQQPTQPIKKVTKQRKVIRSHLKNFEKLQEEKKELSKPILVVSVGIDRHEGEYLKSTINLVGNLENYIEKIDILLGGSLHRWNFWNFSPLLSNENLEELLQEIPDSLSIEKLAFILAEKFYPHAMQAEEDYIKENRMTF